MIKALFILLGSASLALGLIGILLPGLPTTPFLLLTAALYMRGSERFYNLLMKNKHLGGYIHRYRQNKGMSLRAKINSILLQWAMISASVIWGIQNPVVRYVVLGAGLVGSLVIIFAIPTIKKVR